MKTLVLGGEGMLGHKMFQTLRGIYPDTCCTIFGKASEPLYGRTGLYESGSVLECVDAMDTVALKQRLSEAKPDYLINCIGIVKQRAEAHAYVPSIAINSLLPHLLAQWAQEWGGRVVHFSTDCVFSGSKGNYSEDDPSDADDLYGKSKFLGEAAGANALTLRTSIIGRELFNFKSMLEWFLSQDGKSCRGFTKVIYSGVTTNYMSGLVARIIAQHPELSGLYQVVSPPITKHELLCAIRDAFGMQVQITPSDGEVSDRSMVGAKFVAATGYSIPEWPELVAELANDPTPYEKWR